MNPPKFLMCPPEYFGVDYVINPWMEGQVGAVDHGRACSQWDALHDTIIRSVGAENSLVTPSKGLPDMVFTANAGVVKDRAFIPSRFRHVQRRGEEILFEGWFEGQGYAIRLVEDHHEGAGDFLSYETMDGGTILFAAHGFRSTASAHARIGKLLGQQVVSLELQSPSFYHLDTCFCPLPGSRLLWFPPAFTAASVEIVERLVPADSRYAVDENDAARFACNAIAVPGHVVMNDCGESCRRWLEGQGFAVHTTNLSEFMKAGGAAKCLSLQLA